MWRLESLRALDDDQFKAVDELLTVTARHDGFPALSDHLLIALEHRGGPGFAAILADDDTGGLAGYAQLSAANQSTTIELVVAPTRRDMGHEMATLLLRTALEIVEAEDGGRPVWWVHHPDEQIDAIAAEAGLVLDRRLLQMRRPLPVHETTTVETRAFVVGRDEQEWVRVNNAAFEGHSEQGGWTIETLQQREAEPWFDAEGFRLHERDGRLVAFCWTKVHPDTEPPMGEIYVIAVDPPFHGLGLGKALTIAGLDHLGSVGLTVGMLHVDAANASGLGLYQRLGFATDHEDRAYTSMTGQHRIGAHP
jgi:mycothiol synthase